MERGSIPNHQPGAFEPNLSCACKKNKQQQRAAHQLPPASTGALERHERTFGRLGTTQVMFMVVILAGAVQICQAPCGQLLLAQGRKRGRAMCTYNIGHPRRGRVLGTDRQRQAAQNSNRQDADDREFGHGGVSMCTRKIAKARRNAPQRAANARNPRHRAPSRRLQAQRPPHVTSHHTTSHQTPRTHNACCAGSST